MATKMRNELIKVTMEFEQGMIFEMDVGKIISYSVTADIVNPNNNRLTMEIHIPNVIISIDGGISLVDPELIEDKKEPLLLENTKGT